ncbi:MAG TPA: plastocyanin/azurin family copper-binding protein [Mycobacteriales bacterium]
MTRADAIRRSLPRLLALLGVLLLAVACGSDAAGGGAAPAPSAPSGSAPAGGGSTVVIDNFMFMPATLTVPVGTTVTWKFDDSTDHTVTADDKSFSSPPTSGGRTFTHTFSTAGTVKYHCSIHPFMTGTIVVR